MQRFVALLLLVAMGAAVLPTTVADHPLQVYIVGSLPTGPLDDLGAVVTTGPTWPADPSMYDVIIYQNYDAAASQPLQPLFDHVSAGGGLILHSGVPFYLCNSTDLSCLSWFGAATYYNPSSGSSAYTSRSDALGSGLAEGTLLHTTPTHPAGIVIPDTLQIDATWPTGEDRAFAAHAEYGMGRVVFLSVWADTSGGPDPSASRTFSSAAVTWTANEAEAAPPVPEPASVLLVVAGVALLGAVLGPRALRRT